MAEPPSSLQGNTPVRIPDLHVRVPEERAPKKVLVFGTTMDYHGDGVPLPALRRLASRLTEPDTCEPTGEGSVVGLVDTAMCAHPWLEGGYLAAPDEFLGFDPDEDGDERILHHMEGHSTFIAGLILQQAPGAAVWVERSLDESGKATAESVERAAWTLAKRGVHILNLSLGSFDDTPAVVDTLRTMTNELLGTFPELVIVASAGNKPPGSESHEFYPAAVRDDRVVAVGSVNCDDSTEWAAWSNRGSWVDLAANGRNVLSTYIDRAVRTEDGSTVEFEGWARWSGTSFAAAIVSGAIARELTRGSGQSAIAVVQALRNQQDPRTIPDNVPIVKRRSWDKQIERTAKPYPATRRHARERPPASNGEDRNGAG